MTIGCPGDSHRDYPMFNNRQPLEPIEKIPPAEAEADFYAALETEAVAAYLMTISLRHTRRGSIFGWSAILRFCLSF